MLDITRVIFYIDNGHEIQYTIFATMPSTIHLHYCNEFCRDVQGGFLLTGLFPDAFFFNKGWGRWIDAIQPVGIPAAQMLKC